jgi:hypothetical protein
MTILPPSTSIGRIYNLISTIANLLALFISSTLLCLIIYRFNRLKSIRTKISSEISIILCINTVCLLITRSLLQFIDIDLNTIKRNYLFMMEYENSFSCQFRAYLLLSIHAALYWSYALHAFFRFIRVISPKSKRLHQLSTYIYVLIPCQFLISLISTFPLFRGFNVIYLLPNEPYCTASYNELASLIYMPIVAFVSPLMVISICYVCILWKTTHSKTLLRPYQQRNRRDYLVLRRIIIIIVILSMVSLPLFVDLFIYLPKGYIDPYMNSIGWVSSTINAVILAISLPFINQRVRDLFRKKIEY